MGHALTHAGRWAAAIRAGGGPATPVVVLDLAGVRFLSARGVGELARAAAWARTRQFELRLGATSRRVRRVLDLTGATTWLHTDTDTDTGPR